MRCGPGNHLVRRARGRRWEATPAARPANPRRRTAPAVRRGGERGVARLVELGGRHVPLLSAWLSPLDRFFGTERERWALGRAYAQAPSADFSRDVLEPAEAELMVSHMPVQGWCEPGRPTPAFQAAPRLDPGPPWLDASRPWQARSV
jgi:hypothetical protein